MNGEREEKEIKCGTIQRSAPAQPGGAREQKREHVNRHALAERLESIK